MKNDENKERKRFNIRISQDTFDWLNKMHELNNTSINQIVQDILDSKKEEKPKVRIKDYEKETHYLLLALQSVGISLDYLTADLIYMTMERLNEKGGNMSINDTSELQINHQKKWKTYFESLKHNEDDKDDFREDNCVTNKDVEKRKIYIKKIRKNGFHYYDGLSYENQSLWLNNFENRYSENIDKKKIQDELEVFLNGYFNNLRDFLTDSFSWGDSNEGFNYWNSLTLGD